MDVANPLAISVLAPVDGVLTVRLSGELDMATAPQLTEALTSVIRSAGPKS